MALPLQDMDTLVSSICEALEDLSSKKRKRLALKVIQPAPFFDSAVPFDLFNSLLRVETETCFLQVSGLVDGLPYAFFGHSLGALVAYETARRANDWGALEMPRWIDSTVFFQ